MPVLQKKALFSAFIICQVLRIIQNYMEVSPAKSLILSATIHGGSYFFIQPRICAPRKFLNDFLKEWVVRMDELKSGEITRDEYFEWKINWPQTCDGCGKYEPKKQWCSAKSELSET